MKKRIVNIITNHKIYLPFHLLTFLLMIQIKCDVLKENPFYLLYLVLFSAILSYGSFVFFTVTVLTKGWKVKILANHHYVVQIRFFNLSLFIGAILLSFWFYFFVSTPFVEKCETLYEEGIYINGLVVDRYQKGSKGSRSYVVYEYNYNGKVYQETKLVTSDYYDKTSTNSQITIMILEDEPTFHYPLINGIENRDSMLSQERHVNNLIRASIIFVLPFFIFLHLYRIWKHFIDHKKIIRNFYLRIENNRYYPKTVNDSSSQIYKIFT